MFEVFKVCVILASKSLKNTVLLRGLELCLGLAVENFFVK